MKKLLALALCTVIGMHVFAAALVDSSKVKFTLADKEKGSTLLRTEDDYTENLSAFDMSARLKTGREVTKEEYLEFASDQAEDWTKEEESVMGRIFTDVKNLFRGYKINLPEEIFLVKTTGLEEGDSAYCRKMDAIFIAKSILSADYENLLTLFVHELFHIFSKNNLDVREKLYNQIGFYKTHELVFPKNIAPYKITNPDSVNNNYYFDAVIDGKKQKVIPVLLATDKYDEKKGGEFFEYMALAFVGIDIGKNECTVKTQGGKLAKTYCIYTCAQISNYFEKVGMNTDYIISPEEILADNFALLMTGAEDIESPEIIENMKKTLKKIPCKRLINTP